MNKSLKILRNILLGIVGIIFVLLLFLGPVAKTVVHRMDDKIIGRQIHVEKLKINILTGKIRIYHLQLKEKDSVNDFVSFDTLRVSMRWHKLIHNKVFIPHIHLINPQIHLAQNEEGFNFNDIIERFSNDTNPKDTTPSNWKIGIYDIRLNGGDICFNDLIRDKEWNLKDLNINIPGIYFDGEQNTDAGISLSFPNNGTLTTKMKYNMGNNDFEAAIHIKKFALENLYPYLVDFMAIQEIKGSFDGDIYAKGNLDDILQTNIYGNLLVQKCKFNDLKDKEILLLNKLDIAVNNVNIEDQRFEIEHVHIDGLNTHFDQNKDGSTNFSQLFITREENGTDTVISKEEEHSGKTKASGDASKSVSQDSLPPSKEMYFLIKDLKVENSNFTYNDYKMEEIFSFPLTNIRIKAENLQLQNENKMQMLTGLPDGGYAQVQWKGNISQYKKNQHLVINVKNLNMRRFSPYTVHYLAYPLTDGVFSFISENNVKQSQLQGENKIDIFNLSVGEKRKELKPEVNIPLKAAVYILNDKDQKINLDIPVSGDLDNPEFSYMKIIWKTLSNLLIKVSLSPLQYMAEMMGMTEAEMSEMKINPIQFDFTSEQYDFLSKLAQLIKQDSNVSVHMKQQINWEKAAHQLSLYKVKRDYYLFQNPEKQNYRLQLVDFEKINEINTKDLDFETFLNEKVGEDWEKKSMQEKAEKCYPIAQMRQELQQIANGRNQYLHYFLVKQSGVKENQLQITTSMENSEVNAYKIESEVIEENNAEDLEDAIP